METRKPHPFSRGSVAILAAACLVAPMASGAPDRGANTAATELSRRSNAIEEAQVLLRKGDEAYTAEKYSDAVEAYAGARDLLPNAPVAAELRKATTERYAQASVEAARLLARKGDVPGAKAVVDKVLAPDVAPKNPGALAFRAQLDDPIRTNPALTKEHAKDVDTVRRLLYTAEGAYNLGKFDEANNQYRNVLRVDPTNTAARRGMENVERAKTNYRASAYDQARKQMLENVDAAWELQSPPTDAELTLARGTAPVNDQTISLRNKIDRIMIPRVDLDQSTLAEALDFVRVRARENDTFDGTGVNITVNLGDADPEAAQRIRDTRFDLHVSNLPLSQLLKYIADQTHTSYSTDDFSVVFRIAGSTSAELVMRTYRVPPDFLSSISTGGNDATQSADPFATPSSNAGLLPERLNVRQALEKQGVVFPDGASVSLVADNLRVLNTEANQEYISQIVDAVAQTEPVMVKVSVTIIKAQQNDLEELGFDWLLDNFGFGGPSWVPGNSKLNLGGGTVGNGQNIDDITLAPGQYASNPITSGNRSGDTAISNNAIDDLIQFPRGRQTSYRAPGVLGVRGEVSNATVQMLMRGLNQKKGTDIMARPSTVTRSGQSASIAVIREMLYPTEYEPAEIPTSTGNNNDDDFGFGGGGGGATPVTPATPTAFKKRDIGMFMEVMPVADPSKQFVTVTLSPTFSDFDGFVNYGSPINSPQTDILGIPVNVPLTENTILMPVFSKNSFSTSLDIADGSTIVAGGLLQDAVQNVEDKIPVLGSIPIIGRLFQSKARKSTSTALIFLVNVELMDLTGRSYRDR